ncbi:permease for cytosine/purines, uracil, thiamine, allantoin-domain-containing protein [Limtongia smithiae]|uniref:permease for cytosine/purines, uracil, thiamine, allantoin-domain-containing protein n=1 Tax=Limtongia smithiae TaxID=1125753 RepID=UPI0034CDB774
MDKQEYKTASVEVSEGSVPVTNGETKPLGFWAKVNNFILLESADESRYSNHDLDPVPFEEQGWKMRNYAVFWISDNLSVSGFRSAASVMELGLSWQLSVLCLVLANLVIGVVITINGINGTHYHIPFSIQSRASFGYYMSYVVILMRCIVGIFWYGIQAYTGAECVQSMLYAIWPSFRNVPNRLPENANITTQFMTAYIIYFVTCLPCHYVGVHKMKWLFLIKAIATPIASFGIMGWIVHQVGFTGYSYDLGLKGSSLAWTFVGALNSNMGSGSTLMVNAPDYARYARRERDTYITAIMIPLTATVITIIGVVAASGSAVLYGSILWDPLEIIDHWTSAGGRAAAFFCALAFYLSQLGLNIAANSLASANDMNCIFPRYINIRRGQFIAAVLGAWALTPWNILTSATAFLNFMGGYSIWLGPICGILVADYFFVHKRKYDTYELYNFDGIYKYKYGCNWRAFVSFTIAWVPLLPGFIPVVTGNDNTIVGMTHLYKVGFYYCFLGSILTYTVICHFWPAKETYINEPVYAEETMSLDGMDDTPIEVVEPAMLEK